jgi:S-DNA-T family DNA segregation ATPase FtsK/SpoIIIE
MENQNNINENAMVKAIVALYRNFNVAIKVISITEGPSTTLVEVQPIGNTKVSAITALEDELTVALSAKSILINVLPGRGTIGIEVSTGKQTTVPFVFDADAAKGMELPIFLGKDVTGASVYKDLSKAPQLLVAGATGQGKSVFINAVVASVIESKANVKFMMIDPKKVELTVYKDLGEDWFFNTGAKDFGPITDPIEAYEALGQLCVEMDERYMTLQNAKVRNIVEAKAKGIDMPYVVCIIDEFADLIITNKAVETPVVRLAQLGRACGIHIVLATQRPSAQVVTGLIKANFPTRIAFRTASNMDSRVILDRAGAQKLSGKGDMLYSSGTDFTRIQCSFIDMPEVEELVVANTTASNVSQMKVSKKETKVAGKLDEMTMEVAKMFYNENKVSAMMVQRRFKVGFDKAVSIIERLAELNVVTPYENNQSEIKMSWTSFMEMTK